MPSDGERIDVAFRQVVFYWHSMLRSQQILHDTSSQQSLIQHSKHSRSNILHCAHSQTRQLNVYVLTFNTYAAVIKAQHYKTPFFFLRARTLLHTKNFFRVVCFCVCRKCTAGTRMRRCHWHKPRVVCF